MKQWLLLGLFLGLNLGISAEAETRVNLHTTHGVIELTLLEKQAPKTVENFLHYVDSYFYDGLIFHRVIDGFMIQTGGITYDLQRKETRDPVSNESSNGLRNVKYSVAMARLPHPDSATSQFFINVANNRNLDYQKDKPGYTVFGYVSGGTEVVDTIAKVPTTRQGRFQNLPTETVQILRTERLATPSPATGHE